MPPTTEEFNYLADFDGLDDGLDSPVSQDEPQDNEEINGTGNASSDWDQGLPDGQTRGCAEDVVIAVMGSTGTGKSSFIKLLSGDTSIVIGDSLESETSDIQVIHFVDRATGRNVTIVDTPGFDDSRKGVTDTDILKNIANFLVDAYDKKRKLNGFIYLQRISDPRFGGQSSRNLRMFQNLCGPDACKNIIVLTTFWDKVTDEIGAKREKQLKENFFKQLVDCGACFMRHDMSFQSAQDVLRHILPLVPTDTLIGKEIVDDGKNLDQTAAGSVHSKDVEEIIAKHKKEMAELTGEIVEIRKTNKALARELQTERAQLKEKLAKWENERLELKKGLEDQRNAVMQLKADTKAEKERHEKWCQETEHEWTVRLDSQASMHSRALKGIQHQLEQEREESRKSAQRMEELMRRVEERAEKDRKMLEDKRRKEARVKDEMKAAELEHKWTEKLQQSSIEAAQAKTKAFDIVKGQVTLSGLGDIKIVGGHGTHMDATIVANVFNSSAIDITVSSSVEMSYDQARIGYAELMGLRLHPGNNVVPLRWKLQPRSEVNAKARDFINHYIATSKEIPVLLHAKIANITISDQQRTFHDLEAHSNIQGIGSRFVSRVDAYTGIGFGLFLKGSIDFKFVFENPLDTPVTIHDFVVDASIQGTRIIYVKHIFSSFTVPGKERKQTPLIPDAYLVQGYVQTLALINMNHYLDVAINAATVSVGSFRLEALQFNLTNVPFSVSI